MRKLIFGAVLALAAGAMGLADTAEAFERTPEGDIIVFGGRQQVPVLDPHVRYDWSTRMMQQAVYDALAKYVGDPPEIVPWLAESWEVNDDATVWTFHLAQNARFHNGDPVDAEAVRYSFERGLKLNQGVAWMLSDFLEPEGIEAVDEQTVRFNLTKPYAAFISFVPWWYVVNPNEVMANEVDGDYGTAWLTENAAGSGPMAFAWARVISVFSFMRVLPACAAT
jgi:peptide/nickel transport system substrate-binding protein